jgi:hypothetical protein
MPLDRLFTTELLGSFFITLVVVLSVESKLREIVVAAVFSTFLYCFTSASDTEGPSKVSLNLTLAFAFLLGRKWTYNAFFVSLIGQVIGILLGALLGMYLRIYEPIANFPPGQKWFIRNYSPESFVAGIMFSFLISLVTVHRSVEGIKMAYPIVLGVAIVGGALCCTGTDTTPFTAWNPLIEFAFYDASHPLHVFLRVISYVIGGLLGGLYKYLLPPFERHRNDEYRGEQHSPEEEKEPAEVGRAVTISMPRLMPSPITQPSGYRSWLTGLFMDGLGSLFLSLAFGISGVRSEDLWPVAVGCLLTSSIFFSEGGYLSPTVTLAMYLQDRNCPNPTISTRSLLSYVGVQLLFALIGAFIAVYLGSGRIALPLVSTNMYNNISRHCLFRLN